MSEIEELDLDEWAKQLAYTDELTHGDFSDSRKKEESRGLTRQELLKRGGVGAAALGGLGALAGPAAARPASSGKFTGTLRVISLGVEWPQGAQQQAEKDLGFKFNVQLMGTNQQVQRAITAPESFDVAGMYNYQYLQFWQRGKFIPYPIAQIKDWNRFYKVFSQGRINPRNKKATVGQGDAPFRILFVDPDGSTGLPAPKVGPKNKGPVQWIDEKTGKPFGGKPQPKFVLGSLAHFNSDSMGYNSEVIQKRPEQLSWAELLNAKHKGRVALLNDPGIMSQDAGLAVRALGIMDFKNIGDQTRAEIDRLVKVLIKFKKQGQFRAFWNTFNESVNLMASKEVVIESMWSPAVALLVAQKVPVRYAFPKEGMRGWVGTQGIPAHVADDPDKLQAAFDYMNWMTEGFLGSLIMRQGYYVANGQDLPKWIGSERAQLGTPPFTMDEYNFWYLGKRAPKDLPGITGQVGDVRKGQARDGREFSRRLSRYATWNSTFTETVFQTKRINDFLSA